MEAITQQYLKDNFIYLDSGAFVRKSTNKQVPAKINKGHRYPRVSVAGKPYSLHRLVWLYHYGFLPDRIDHINNIRTDCRIENLRECTQAENCRNRRKHANGANTHKNVYWHKASNKWIVQVTKSDGVRQHVGLFEAEVDAVAAAQLARESEHKEFCNHGG